MILRLNRTRFIWRCDSPLGSRTLWLSRRRQSDCHKGGSKGEIPAFDGNLYLYAMRALLYGTCLTVVFSVISAKLAAQYYGFSSTSDVLDYIRDHPVRHSRQLEKRGITEIKKTISLSSIYDDWHDIVNEIESKGDDS
ncbi:hypothetical protein XU18_3340 [Perkinsela sp. CCAP 1560/4]|nr:hypothetical protein XU18_4760 [Perkinsela sp. CCAP 1560/4]KNH05672.1 hypothetical protein XU18_3340 [Perkinsela sp. CCAP 1560/4]|eukprot:KNH03952.1 hypothetical protein XU18_4760 [Perkinsela sp. CCAP 1560/4]